MFKLLVDNEVKNPTIVIRWCLDAPTLAHLKKWEVEEPYVLLVIYPGQWKKEERMLVPLKQMMEYVQLRHPGENKIFATIVWDQKDGYKELWKKYIRKEDGRYVTTLVCDDGETPPHIIVPYVSMESADLDIVVPAELFAKEPPAWEKRWVNFWFEQKPKDQCQYRRRRMLAYTLQPPVVLLYLLTLKLALRTVVASFLLACGFWVNFNDSWNPKKWEFLLNLRAFIHPWNMGLGDLVAPIKKGAKKIGPFVNMYVFIVLGCMILIILGINWVAIWIWRFIVWAASLLYRLIKPVITGATPLMRSAYAKISPSMKTARTRFVALMTKFFEVAFARFTDLMSRASEVISRLPVKRKTMRRIMYVLGIALVAILVMMGSEHRDTKQAILPWWLVMSFFGFMAGYSLLLTAVAKGMAKKYGAAEQRSVAATMVREEEITRHYTPYEALLCENYDRVDPKKVVPIRQKVHLYYQDLKQLVCKPFAG